MSLEDKIDAMTAALNRNSDLLEVLTGRAEKGLANKAEAETKKPVEEEAPKRTRSAKPAEEEAPKRTRSAAKEKAPTPKEMGEATTTFLDVEAEDEFEARRALVKKLLAHFDAPKMSEIEESKRQSALDALAAYKAGDDPFENLRGGRGGREDLA